jgi:SAM-dependent methyltransferase
VRSLLENPKVSIAIDDGRRWMVSHGDAKFDVIVSNTSFHWRDHTSGLLSKEFLELVRAHLKPGGVFFYNLTGSAEGQRTGVSVFRYAVMVGNCMAASDSPLSLDLDRWKRVMLQYRIDGAPVFDLTRPEHLQKWNEVIGLLPTRDQAAMIRSSNRATRMITDDNMGTEWQKVE